MDAYILQTSDGHRHMVPLTFENAEEAATAVLCKGHCAEGVGHALYDLQPRFLTDDEIDAEVMSVRDYTPGQKVGRAITLRERALVALEGWDQEPVRLD